MKLCRKKLLIELGILATLVIHNLVTKSRGYSAIGGEFLVVPLVYVLYIIMGQAVNYREEVK